MGSCMIYSQFQRNVKINTYKLNNQKENVSQNKLEIKVNQCFLFKRNKNLQNGEENDSLLIKNQAAAADSNLIKKKSMNQLSEKGEYTIEFLKAIEEKKRNFFKQISFFKLISEESLRNIVSFTSICDKFKLQYVNKKIFNSSGIPKFEPKIFEILGYLKKITKPRINHNNLDFKDKIKEKKVSNFIVDHQAPKNYQKEMIALLRRFNNYKIQIISEALAIYILMTNELLGYKDCNHIEINSKYQKKTLEIYHELSRLFLKNDIVFCFSGVFDFLNTNSKITRNSHVAEKELLREILKNANTVRFNFEQHNPYYKHSKDDTVFFLKTLLENNKMVKIKNCKLNLNETIIYLIKYSKKFPNNLEFFNYFESIEEDKAIELFDLNTDSIVKIDDRLFHLDKINAYLETKFFKNAKHFKNQSNTYEKSYFEIDKIFLKDLEPLDKVEYIEIFCFNKLDFFSYFRFLPANILYLNLEGILNLHEIEIVFQNIRYFKTLQYLKFRFREGFHDVINENEDDFKEIKEVEENNYSIGNCELKEKEKSDLQIISKKNTNKDNNDPSQVENLDLNCNENFNLISKYTKSIGSPGKRKQSNFSSNNVNFFSSEVRKTCSKKFDFFEEIKKPSAVSPVLPFRPANLRKKFYNHFVKRHISHDHLDSHLKNINNNNNPELVLTAEKTQTINFIKNGMHCVPNRTTSCANLNSIGNSNNNQNVSTIIEELEKTHRAGETKKNFFGNFIEKETASFYVDNILDIEIPNKFYLLNLIFEVITLLLKNRNDKKVFDVRFDVLLLNQYCEYLENLNLKRIKDKIKIVSYIRDWPIIGKKFVPFKKLSLPFENLILLNVDFNNVIKGEKATQSMSVHINQIMGLLNEELKFVFKNLKKLEYFYVNEIEEKFFFFNNFPFEFLDEKGVKIINISPRERNNHFWDTRIKKLDYL